MSLAQVLQTAQHNVTRIEQDLGAAQSKEFGELLKSVRTFVSRLGQAYILGYNPARWSLNRIDGRLFYAHGEEVTFIYSSTHQVYQVPSTVVGLAFTATAIEIALEVHSHELDCSQYAMFSELINQLELNGLLLDEQLSTSPLFQLIRTLAI